MTTLREQKKRATRRALTEAAATLVLDGGTEALTVAKVAAAAKVSPRTFHNYFASTQEALLGFALDVLEVLAAEIPDYPAQLSATEVFEEVMLHSVSNEGMKLYSLMTLFRIHEILDALAESADYEAQVEEILNSFVVSIHPRLPELEAWEVKIVLHSAAAACVVAYKELHAMGPDVDIETRRAYIRRAFTVLRGIR